MKFYIQQFHTAIGDFKGIIGSVCHPCWMNLAGGVLKDSYGEVTKQHHRRHPGGGAGDPDEVEPAQGAA
jgi:hypothetical protein